MSQVLENVCDALGHWTFTAPSNPPALPPGNYSIAYGTNSYLTLDAKQQIVLSTVNSPWYFTTSTDKQGQIYYYLNAVANGLETASGTLLTVLPDSTQTQLVYANDQTQASALPIQISTDQTIFDNNAKNYFVPNSLGTAVVITDVNDPNKSKWSFTALACATPTPLPTGEYSLSFANSQGVPQYLSFTTQDKTFGSVMVSSPSFNLTTSTWKYDADKKTLSTGCQGTPLYLSFDLYNPMWAILTSDVSKAATNVVLTAEGIRIGTYQALVPAVSGNYVMVYSCLAPAASLWKNALVTSSLPTGGPPSGYYVLKYGDQCLNVSGGGVVLDACPVAPVAWKYDAANYQLSYQGQCLINPSSACSSFSNLSLGACSDPNSKRFFLGPNSIYDPVLQFCYGLPSGSPRQSDVFRDCNCSGARLNRTSPDHHFRAWYLIVILLTACFVGALLWWGWKRRSVTLPQLSRH